MIRTAKFTDTRARRINAAFNGIIFMALTRELAAYIVASRPADIPAAVQHQGVRAFFNYVGCALGGCRDPAVEIALETLAEFAGPPQATLIGRRERFDVLSADIDQLFRLQHPRVRRYASEVGDASDRSGRRGAAGAGGTCADRRPRFCSRAGARDRARMPHGQRIDGATREHPSRLLHDQSRRPHRRRGGERQGARIE